MQVIDPVRPRTLAKELLPWRDAWLLDIDLLDHDHREMVRLINRLGDENDPAPLATRLDDLIDFLRNHFGVEQHFLSEIGYPDLTQHTREHALQMAEFIDLRRALASQTHRTLGTDDRQAIKHWFFNHVIAQDKRFAAYYRRVVCGA
ncbi:MAG: hypothetical protein EA400_10570 [Chromatiaceae bacterium]|nr:MAG: hypothetical protein EA400_10570 [Chromatiaceae bacterium]